MNLVKECGEASGGKCDGKWREEIKMSWENNNLVSYNALHKSLNVALKAQPFRYMGARIKNS